MPASKISFQNQEPGGHVVVAVGDDRAPLAHGEDLPAEWQLDRQAADVREVDGQALGPFRREIHPGGEPVEVQRLQEGIQVDPLVETLQRLLELDVLRAVFVHVLADRVELLEPGIDDGPDVVPEEPARPESLDQDERRQRLQGIPSKVAAVGRFRFLRHERSPMRARAEGRRENARKRSGELRSPVYREKAGSG